MGDAHHLVKGRGRIIVFRDCGPSHPNPARYSPLKVNVCTNNVTKRNANVPRCATVIVVHDQCNISPVPPLKPARLEGFARALRRHEPLQHRDASPRHSRDVEHRVTVVAAAAGRDWAGALEEDIDALTLAVRHRQTEGGDSLLIYPGQDILFFVGVDKVARIIFYIFTRIQL